ncbi:hypothetical protein [Rhizobium leguminosarum]|uniref:hypothetical protein n=1 Tax=Rhizobium leguminosarum TaxID=384 RepID=UPI00144249EE|nr:hypothetical protein [Rhizobium leguminosarum]MBY5863291.1 hypothetical protein [Rhizobium leguminosarum]NKM04170.1 hypothetical protein [Rhizobium leguminosarum bv. viciae]
MADTLRLWQGLLSSRAVAHELATMELNEASVRVARGDADGMERLTIADRYFHETHRMLKAAERTVAGLAG